MRRKERVRRSQGGGDDPYRWLISAIIEGAIDIIRGDVEGVTEEDRDEAEQFLRGEKCRRWCEEHLKGVDYGRMVRTVFGGRSRGAGEPRREGE